MKLLALCIALLALAAEPAAAKISVYSLPAGSSPFDLTSSPDGSMWASETGADKLARVTPSGQVSQVALPAGSGPLGMSFGATGDVLVAAHGSGKLLHVSTSDGSVKSDELDGQRLPYEVAVSQSDGEPWVTAQPPTAGGGLTQGAIVKSSYCCGPTVYALTGASVTVPYGITNGFNQSMWFTEQRTISEPGYIGRITTNGQITEIPIGPGAVPMDIAQ